MKDKILMLIIGILIGAIIASGCFLVFGKNNDFSKDRANGRDFDTNMIGGGKMGAPQDRDNIGNPLTDNAENTSADI